MKKQLFFLIIIYFLSNSVNNFALFSENVSKPSDLPITVVFSPNIYNQIATSAKTEDKSVNTTSVKTSSKSSAFATIKDIAFVQKVTDNSAALLGYLTALLNDRQKQQSLLEHLQSTLYEYKWRIIFGTAFGGYCYATYKLKSLEHALINNELWSQWKKAAVSELYLLSDSELSADLLRAIQKKYTSLSALEDFNTPLISFINDVKKEEKLLDDYQKFVKKLELLRVASYFSINHSLLDSIATRKDKLAYLQSRLWNWVSEYKVNSHLK